MQVAWLDDRPLLEAQLLLLHDCVSCMCSPFATACRMIGLPTSESIGIIYKLSQVRTPLSSRAVHTKFHCCLHLCTQAARAVGKAAARQRLLATVPADTARELRTVVPVDTAAASNSSAAVAVADVVASNSAAAEAAASSSAVAAAADSNSAVVAAADSVAAIWYV